MPLSLLLIVTMLENMASAMIQIGLFFFTSERLGFTPTQNLLLAVLHGATYIVGALLSHPLSARLGERRTLVAVLVTQAAMTGFIAWRPDAGTVWLLTPVLLALYGMKWPVVESYVVAGRTPKQTTAALGKFNVTWSGAVALAGTFAGTLIAWGAAPLFIASAAATAVSIVVCVTTLPKQLQHLPADHPERPTPRVTRRYGQLLKSNRWTMMTSYALERVAVPLLPAVFASFGVGVAVASALAVGLAWSRTATFAALGAWPGWHGRRAWPALAALALPGAALLSIEGPALTWVVLGLVGFGVCQGVAYTGSLYYAMVLKNASVDAGGAHEAIIGGGFVVGPAVGVGAQKLSAAWSSTVPAWIGMGVGLVPLIGVGMWGGLWPLRRAETETNFDAEFDQPVETGATA